MQKKTAKSEKVNCFRQLGDRKEINNVDMDRQTADTNHDTERFHGVYEDFVQQWLRGENNK